MTPDSTNNLLSIYQCEQGTVLGALSFLNLGGCIATSLGDDNIISIHDIIHTRLQLGWWKGVVRLLEQTSIGSAKSDMLRHAIHDTDFFYLFIFSILV